MARRTSHDESRNLGADELEQRQTVAGATEGDAGIVDEHGRPLDADVLEQLLRPDGTYEAGVFDRDSGEPLTADMIEQRQVVEYDDEERSES